jgi:hypothetical protein
MALTKVSGSVVQSDIVLSGIITATSFRGDGSQLTGIDATSLKDSDGGVMVQATKAGAVVTGILTVTELSVAGGAVNDERKHSGSAFQNVVYETPNVIDLSDDLTLTSLYSEDSTMYTKRREVRVADGKTLTIAPGDTFVINPLNL